STQTQSPRCAPGPAGPGAHHQTPLIPFPSLTPSGRWVGKIRLPQVGIIGLPLTEVRGRPLRRSCQCVGLSRAAWYRPPLDWTVRDAPLIAALAIARAGCRSPWLTVGRPTSQGFADALSDAGLALRHDLTVFGQQAPQAIDLRCAELDQLAAHAVQRQDRLLFLGLDRDSFDIRLLNRRPDRVGI